MMKIHINLRGYGKKLLALNAFGVGVCVGIIVALPPPNLASGVLIAFVMCLNLFPVLCELRAKQSLSENNTNKPEVTQ